MPSGRPRQFDADKALDAALAVFWQMGYEGASLPALTAAMGINRPSMYLAFGNKEELFLRAVDRYVEGPASHVEDSFSRPTAREVIETFWRTGIAAITRTDRPRGCFLIQGALACGDDADHVRQEVAKRRKKLEGRFRKRFEKAIKEGDLPRKANAADLARYVVTVSHGMAVQAAGGASRVELNRVVDLALAGIPT